MAPTYPRQSSAPAGVDPHQWRQIADPLLERVGQTIDTRLQPMRDATANLEQLINQMRQPVTDPTDLSRRAPGQISGPLPSECERSGYSYRRICGLQSKGQVSPQECKYELDIHQRLRKAYVEQGGMMLGGDDSILVPFGIDMIVDDQSNVREELRQSLAAGIRGADIAELYHLQSQLPQLRQALSWFDDSALGVFASGSTMGELIQLVRNREVFSRVGASQVTLPPNGRLPFPKQTGSATAYWVGENEAITPSEPTTGSLQLIAKKLASLVKLPNELVRFGNPSVEAFIRNDLARTMAVEADRAMLEGVSSTNRIKGLLNHGGINTHVASTTSADGDTFEPEDVLKALTEVEEDNHDTSSFAWVMRFSMWSNLLNRRTAAVSSGDKEGSWLFRTNRDDVRSGLPNRLSGHPVVTSNQVSNTREKGSSSDLTYILGGVFENWLIGRVGVIEFATSTSGDTAFSNDQTWLRAIQHIDAAPRHEDAFVLVDNLDVDLP